MIDRTPIEPGSPLSLPLFHRWCRGQVVLAMMRGELPELLFADGPRQETPLWAFWSVEGVPPTTLEFILQTIWSWAIDREASQVGLCIPFGGEQTGALLLTVDETGAIAEQALVDVNDDGAVLHEWVDVGTDLFPVTEWQELLAEHAGYDDFAKWRCKSCQSVCAGEAADVPTPCSFCASTEIERVGIEVPLAPPLPPYDENYVSDEEELLSSPFVRMLRAAIAGQV